MTELDKQMKDITQLLTSRSSSQITSLDGISKFFEESSHLVDKFSKRFDKDPEITKNKQELQSLYTLYIMKYTVASATPGSSLSESCLEIGEDIIKAFELIDERSYVIIRGWLTEMIELYRKTLVNLPIPSDGKIDLSEAKPEDFE